jgi:hypothetical protein
VRLETQFTIVLCAVAITLAPGCHAYHPHGYGAGCGSYFQGMHGPVFPNQGFPAGGYPPGAVPGGFNQPSPFPNNAIGAPSKTTDTGTFGSPGNLPGRPADSPFGEDEINRPGGSNPPGSPRGTRTPRGTRPTIDEPDDFGSSGSGASTGNNFGSDISANSRGNKSSGNNIGGKSRGNISTAAGDDAVNRLTSDADAAGFSVGFGDRRGGEDFIESDFIERNGPNARPMAFNDTGDEASNPAAAPPRFDFDRVNDYDWLRGKVVHDRSTNEWRIIYHNGNPAEDRRYGGELTLANPRMIADLTPGRVYLIEGVVDAETKDASGRPTYFISRGWRLRPGTTTSDSAADFNGDDDSHTEFNR